LNADSFFHTKTQTVISLLPGLCGTPFGAILVFPRASWLERHSSMSIASAFAAAPDARFISPREPNRIEYDSTFVANFPGEASVSREKLVALLDRQQHNYSSSTCGALLSERVGLIIKRLKVGQLTFLSLPNPLVGSLVGPNPPGAQA
jgi:hypothetical protein